MQRWTRLRRKYPQIFETPPQEVQNWLEKQLRRSLQVEDWFAASFYVDQLLKNGVASHRLITLREEIPSMRVPARDPGTSPRLIDLGDYFNGSLRRIWEPGVEGQDFSELSPGVQRLAGVDFDVRGTLMVNRSSLAQGRRLPKAIRAIRIEQRCDKLHFLHAADGGCSVGTPIGTYVLHYEGGQSREIPIVYGEDLLDFNEEPTGGQHPRNFEVAWQGSCISSRRMGLKMYLFKRTWTNPLPALKIESLDFVAARAAARPFLVALTVE